MLLFFLALYFTKFLVYKLELKNFIFAIRFNQNYNQLSKLCKRDVFITIMLTAELDDLRKRVQSAEHVPTHTTCAL